MMIELVQMTDFRRPQAQEAAVPAGVAAAAGDFLAVLLGADGPEPTPGVVPLVSPAGPATDGPLVLPTLVPILSPAAGTDEDPLPEPEGTDPQTLATDAGPMIGQPADPGLLPQGVGATLPVALPLAQFAAIKTTDIASQVSQADPTGMATVLPERSTVSDPPAPNERTSNDHPDEAGKGAVPVRGGRRAGMAADPGGDFGPDRTRHVPEPDLQPSGGVGAFDSPDIPAEPSADLEPAPAMPASGPVPTPLTGDRPRRQESRPGMAIDPNERLMPNSLADRQTLAPPQQHEPASLPKRQDTAPDFQQAPDSLPERQDRTPPVPQAPVSLPERQHMTPPVPQAPVSLPERQDMTPPVRQVPAPLPEHQDRTPPVRQVPAPLPERQDMTPPVAQTPLPLPEHQDRTPPVRQVPAPLPERQDRTPPVAQTPLPLPKHQDRTPPLRPAEVVARPPADSTVVQVTTVTAGNDQPRVAVPQNPHTDSRSMAITPPDQPGPSAPLASPDRLFRGVDRATLGDRHLPPSSATKVLPGAFLLVVAEQQTAPVRNQLPSRQAAYDFRLTEFGPPTIGTPRDEPETTPLDVVPKAAVGPAGRDEKVTSADAATPDKDQDQDQGPQDRPQSPVQPTATVQTDGFQARAPATTAQGPAITADRIGGIDRNDPKTPGPLHFEGVDFAPEGKAAGPTRHGDPVTTQVAHLIVHRAEDRAEVLLEPAELGRMRFEIIHRGEGVQILLSAERPETLELLRRNADQLTGEFRAMGFGSADLGFGAWGGGQAKPDTTPWLDPGSAQDLVPADLPTPPPARPSTTGSGGLDLRL